MTTSAVQTIFGVGAVAIVGYFKVRGRGHRIAQAALTALLVVTIAIYTLAPVLSKQDKKDAPIKAAVTQAVSNASPSTEATHRLSKRTRVQTEQSVNQISFGDKSSNIGAVDGDVNITYGSEENTRSKR